MAAFKHFQGMNDPALKPDMLRTLTRLFPDEKHPLDSSFQLSEIVSSIRTHRLLAECSSEPMSEKLIRDWKSAVDDWVNALLLLVSGNSLDKCRVAIYLLGLTCQECSSDRFLASYSNWFHKLLSHIQPPADSQSMKAASCSSLSDILSRLAKFPNEKKEGTSRAGKLIQPILKLLNGDGTEEVWKEAVNLLHLMINLFPTSIRHSYDQVETAISSKMFSGKCSRKMLKKLGYCLAVLPKAKGDDDSWGLLMHKILFLINDHLDDAVHGVEEEIKSSEAKRFMLPPGKDPPPPLGDLTSLSAVRENVSKSSEQLLTSSVCTLMICCCKMLTDSYLVQVNVPILSLLALIERVLMVDGSLPRNRVPFVTTKQQELICLDLPVLHDHCLQLLSAITNGVHSQLLPHVAYVAKLVMKYFKKCTHPELRIKLYSIARRLLLSMGVGMAVYLSRDVVDNACADLKPKSEQKLGASSANMKSSTETLLHACSRKRRHPARTGAFEKQQESTGAEMEPNKHWGTPVSVKIAALQAVKALFVGGATARSESWRSRLDDLLISVAIESSKGGWANEESSSVLADFQLASLSALSVSLCARVRTPHLAQGLELFHKGKREAGPRVAECCADALFMLELFIHPRALPPEDFQSPSEGFPQRLATKMVSGVQKHHNPVRMESGPAEIDDDDLCKRWLQGSEEIDIPGSNSEMHNVKPSETTVHELVQEPSLAGSFGNTKVAEAREHEAVTAVTDSRTRSSGDEIMVESEQIPQYSVTLHQVSSVSDHLPRADRNIDGSGVQVGSGSSERDGRFTDYAIVYGEDASSEKVGKNPTIQHNVQSDKSMFSAPDFDGESSSDSFPDIVDAEPDTGDESESSESLS